MRRAFPLLFVFLLGCTSARPPATSGSATAGATQRSQPRVVDDLELRIRAEVDPVSGLDAYDAQDLFELGLARLDADEPTLARVLFARLVREFPASPLAVPARYNLALSAERQGRTEDAVALFLEYVAVVEANDPAEAAELRLHAGTLAFDDGRWDLALLPLDRARRSGQLDHPDTWLARAMLARIRGREGAWKQSEDELEDILAEIKRRTRVHKELHPSSSALVWYHAASLYRDQAHAQRLLDVDDLHAARAWLDRTAAHFLEARRCYKRVLEHRNPAWSGRAAIELGAINEDFRARMLGADTPTELDAEGTAVYLSLLEEQTRSFLEKAVQDYRWLVMDAADLRILPDDVSILREALARVEAELEPPEETAAAP